MVLPVLQNPVKVTISKIDKSSTKFDVRGRENRNVIKRSSSFDIPCQIVFKEMDNPEYESKMSVSDRGMKTGPVEKSSGYIVVRYHDLDAQNFSIERGDKVTKLGQLDVEYYILGFRPAGHYSDQDGFTLLKVFFQDRNP